MAEQTQASPDVPANGEHRIIVAGFGGQGIQTLGKLLCMAAMGEGRTVTCLPSYGSEVRGGTSKCEVVVSPKLIYSPLVERADSLVILNEQSLEAFGGRLRPGGLLVVNSSAVADPRLPEAKVVAFPAADMAVRIGDIRVANVLMLGAFVRASGIVEEASCRDALTEMLGVRKAELLDVNLEAFRKGAELATSTT
jgi:2-oxoglutarate ferredoxin oxidoreductase subunit gamma